MKSLLVIGFVGFALCASLTASAHYVVPEDVKTVFKIDVPEEINADLFMRYDLATVPTVIDWCIVKPSEVENATEVSNIFVIVRNMKFPLARSLL